MARRPPFQAHARTDARDRYIKADEPLAGLQRRNGGELPGVIVSPALLEMVRKARIYGLKLGQAIEARDEDHLVTAWVEVMPEDEGCSIAVSNWQSEPAPTPDRAIERERQLALVRQLAELTARLGPSQEVLTADSHSAELHDLLSRMRAGVGRPWHEFVELEDQGEGQSMHWRLLDGAKLSLPGSSRRWTARLVPLGKPAPASDGFELYLLPDRPLADLPAKPAQERSGGGGGQAGIGREIAPVLRQPVSRIIANAETIRTQLAGPLAEEYSNYAADIASAGEHLLALIDDLTTLEMVEDEDFNPAPDQIDLADVARRASGILGVRARERGISIDAPRMGETAPAIGEFRRVLQILLNLLGNAIRYSPEGADVWLRVEQEDGISRIIVADQGEGLDENEQARVFNKFERLGRQSDGGSGLGLYISRRLANAMRGTLRVESAKGQGARFILELPADEQPAG